MSPKVSELRSAYIPKQQAVVFVTDLSPRPPGTAAGQAEAALLGSVQLLQRTAKAAPERRCAAAVLSCRGPAWLTKSETGTVPVEGFSLDGCAADGAPSLGAALRELGRRMTRRDMMRSETGNVPPVIVFLCSSAPDEGWETALAELEGNAWFRIASRLAVCFGPEADGRAAEKLAGSPRRVFSSERLQDYLDALRAAAAPKVGGRAAAVTGKDPCLPPEPPEPVPGPSPGGDGGDAAPEDPFAGTELLEGVFRDDSRRRLSEVFREAKRSEGSPERMAELCGRLREIVEPEISCGHPAWGEYVRWDESPDGYAHLFIRGDGCFLVSVFGVRLLMRSALFPEGELGVRYIHWLTAYRLLIFDFIYYVRDEVQRCECFYSNTDAEPLFLEPKSLEKLVIIPPSDDAEPEWE